MAVYTEFADEELEAFIAGYGIGTVLSLKGIAEGVENSNYLLVTSSGPFILTLYENVRSIAITAGASAPEVLVNDVIDAFGERFDVTVTTMSLTDENVFFRVPPIPERRLRTAS